MDISTACRILGIEANASFSDVESAKLQMLKALHPDYHPAAQREVFTRMTRDVIEAADFLQQIIGLNGTRSRDDSTVLEQILFSEGMPYGSHGSPSNSKSLVRYEKRYDSDKVLAVAVLGIDYAFVWRTTPSPLFGGGQPQDHKGCALNLLFMNRTNEGVDNLYVGQNSYLIDDRGFQYSPTDINFYWTGDNGGFNRHSGFIAPNSKVDGFVIFPSLRGQSNKFARWFYRGNLKTGTKLHEANYDVRLS